MLERLSFQSQLKISGFRTKINYNISLIKNNSKFFEFDLISQTSSATFYQINNHKMFFAEIKQ